MPSREGGKVDRPESLVFSHAAKSPPLFVLPRHGYHRLSANNGEIQCERSVGAGDVRRDWGGLLVRLCRVGDHSGAGAQLFPD